MLGFDNGLGGIFELVGGNLGGNLMISLEILIRKENSIEILLIEESLN